MQDEYRKQESELDDLYQDIIIDHYRNPRHKGHLESPTASHEGLNPLCGDEVTIEEFTGMMRNTEEIDSDTLGDLEALSGVRKFPVRIKCATLAWHTLDEALKEASSG